MSPRGSGQVKIWGNFGGSGRTKIAVVYIERAHPFRGKVPVDEFDEPHIVFLVDQTDYVNIRIPTQEILKISTSNDSDFAKTFQ